MTDETAAGALGSARTSDARWLAVGLDRTTRSACVTRGDRLPGAFKLGGLHQDRKRCRHHQRGRARGQAG